jgi:hypothetical protein
MLMAVSASYIAFDLAGRVPSGAESYWSTFSCVNGWRRDSPGPLIGRRSYVNTRNHHWIV